MKSFIDDLVVRCDELSDTPSCVVINPSIRVSYWFIAVVLLSVVYLLLLVVLIVQDKKQELTTPYLLLY